MADHGTISLVSASSGLDVSGFTPNALVHGTAVLVGAGIAGELQTTGQIWPPGPAAAAYTPPVTSVVGSSYLNQGGAGVTSLAPSLPAGLQDGDRLYAVFMSVDTQAGSAVTESITGWTVVNAKADQGTCHRAMYTAVYSAGLAAPSWSLASARKCVSAIVAIRNANPSPQTSMTDLGSTTGDLVAPSITSPPTGVLLRLFVKKDNLSASVTPPAGSTLVTGALGVATGPSGHVLVYSQPPATPTATATATFSATSANGTAWTVTA